MEITFRRIGSWLSVPDYSDFRLSLEPSPSNSTGCFAVTGYWFVSSDTPAPRPKRWPTRSLLQSGIVEPLSASIESYVADIRVSFATAGEVLIKAEVIDKDGKLFGERYCYKARGGPGTIDAVVLVMTMARERPRGLAIA